MVEMVETAKNPFIFGIDILPGSSPRKSNFFFSFTSLAEDGSVIEQKSRISVLDLLELVRSQKPSLLAIDNIFELATNSKAVYRFIEQLPEETKLLQICGSPLRGYEKISTLAKRYLSYTPTKFSPIETSFIAASLALKGIGFIVQAFEEEVKVNVTRQRMARQGGMSQKRYNINAEIAVKRGVDALKDQLENLNFDYDVYEYLPRRAVFYIRLEESQIESIRRIAKELTTNLCQIQVMKIRKNQIEFIPLKSQDTRQLTPTKRVRNLIVGIDPGTTTGIAILDLNGRILTTTSRREFSTPAILRFILEYGKSVIIASDVRSPIPKTVEKLAKITGAVLISPEKAQTSQTEKRALIADYLYLCRDSHSRDALFAALKAYNSVKTKLIRTKKLVFNEYPELLPILDRIRADVLKSNSMENAIKEASKLLEIPTPDLIPAEEPPAEVLKYQRKIAQQNHEIEELGLELDYYRDALRNLKREYEHQMNKYDRLRRKKSFELERDKRIAQQMRQIDRIENKCAELEKENLIQQKQILELQELRIEWEKGRWIPLSGVSVFSEDAIRHSSIRAGSVVVIENPSGGGSKTASLLVREGIRAVIIPKNAPELTSGAKITFFEAGIPVIPMNIGKGVKALEIVKKEEKIFIGERDVLESIIQEIEAQIRREKQIREDKGDMGTKSDGLDLETIIKEANEEWIRRRKKADRERHRKRRAEREADTEKRELVEYRDSTTFSRGH
ncbi:MAG: DUF460 domain-containing protein [Candidatus Hodarchaeota archaeon]